MKNRLLKRSEVKESYCWNIKDIYISDEDWESDYEQIKSKISYYNRLKNDAEKNAKSLLKLLDFNFQIEKNAEKLYVYANQKSHEDMTVSIYQDMAARAAALLVKLEDSAAFISPFIMSLGEEKIDKFVASEPGLRIYRRYFDIIFRKKEHILDEKTESMLARVSDISSASSDIFAMFNNADIKFPVIKDENGEDVQITNGKYVSFLRSSNRDVRKAAFDGLYSVYNAHKNMLAATYRANTKQRYFYAETRKYGSAMEYSLSDANIPVSVYEKLIEATRNYLPLLHKYVGIRKKALGLSKLHMYDMYVPLVKDMQMKISYEEAKRLVYEAMEPLGKEYQQFLKIGFEGGWIDVYENEGKRSGAYSWGCYESHPYVLLNHQDDLNSVFTLAHEMGHALHSYYSNRNQPYIYAGYKIFVAEVASTCNEALLVNYLLKHSKDKNEKLYLLNYFLEQFRTTFFRQTMFAEFEKITHEMTQRDETLTAENMCAIYKQLNEDYFGEEAFVDDEIAIEWARIPHFYTPFYVYQYATGFAASVSISSAILAGDKKVLDGYMEFLKSGGSKDPIDLLKLCGVDMNTGRPVEMCMKTFERLLEQFSRELED